MPPMEGVLSRTRETGGGSIPSGGKCISRAGAVRQAVAAPPLAGEQIKTTGGAGNGRSIEFWRNAEVGAVSIAILFV